MSLAVTFDLEIEKMDVTLLFTYGLTQVLTTGLPTTLQPSTLSGYKKETQCTKCTTQSHPRWLQWVAA
jgi:hypothetical protein